MAEKLVPVIIRAALAKFLPWETQTIMLDTIKRLLAPPVFQGDEEKTRRASFLNELIGINLLVAVLITAAVFLGNNVPSRSQIIVILWMVLLALAWRILHSGRISFIAFALSILCFVFLTGANISLGTVRTPTTALYVIWILVVGILFQLPGILIAASASSLAVLGLILAESAGLLPQPNYSVGVTQWLNYTALFGMTAGMVYYGNRITRNALARAKNEIEQRKQTEMEQRTLTRAVEQSPASIVITDLNGNIQYVNPRFCSVTGYSFDEAVGKNPRILKTDQTRAGTHRQLWDTVTAGHEWRGEFVNRKKDGSVYHELAIISPITDFNGVVTHYLAVKEDITERKRAEEAAEASALQIKRADTLLRTAVETINEAFVIFDSDDCLVFCNEKYRQVYAESAHLMVPGVSFETLIRNSAKQGRYLAAIGRVEEWVSERLDAHRASGGTPIIENHATGGTLLTVERRTPEGYIVGFRVDVTELQQAKQELQEKNDELESIAKYDTLTGLPNRAMLTDRMNQALSQSRRSGQQVGVVFLDLDGFKAVNDTHGHDAGDYVLITLAERMKLTLREGDTLARLGGDEFVAMLLNLADADASAPMLNRLLAAAAQPVQFGDAVLQVSASLGVTFYPQAQEIDADQLLRQADQAMYQAKQTGKNRYAVFNAAQDRLVREHHESMQSIRRALTEDEFELYYQPKVNMRTGAVIGAEALIRWAHPERGLLPPSQFLPMIEDHPLAVDLGQWVIRNTLAQIELWQRAGLSISISVNIGWHHLQQADFVLRLRETLAAQPQLKPGCLELELLETSTMHDLIHLRQVIEECRQMGVKTALDDFGVGYSSLTYLKSLSVDQLKINRSFLRHLLDDTDSMIILTGVLNLTRAMDLPVIVVGVETVEHGVKLRQLGCELAQGYAIAHPMPAAALPDWIGTWQPDPAWTSLS